MRKVSVAIQSSREEKDSGSGRDGMVQETTEEGEIEWRFFPDEEGDGEGYHVGRCGVVALMSEAGERQLKTRSRAFPPMCVGEQTLNVRAKKCRRERRQEDRSLL